MIFWFFFLEFELINKIRNIETIAWTTIIFGILLYISDKFSIENDTLIYAPLNLKIVPTAEYQKVLDEIYDKQVGIPSIHDFHNQVNKTHYINRKYTTEYLKKKGDYQISRPFQRKPTNKPVIVHGTRPKTIPDSKTSTILLVVYF